MKLEEFNFFQTVIYFLCAFISFLCLLRITNGKHIPYKLDVFFLILFSSLYMLLFGFRDKEVGSDTYNYVRIFNLVNTNNFNQEELNDYLFIYLSKIIGFVSDNPRYILVLVAMIYILLFYIFLRKIPSKNKIIIFFVFVSTVFFKNMGINILRQGIAEMFFLLSLMFSMNDKKIKYVLISIFSFFTHATLIIPIIVYYLSNKIIGIKINALISVYLIAIVLSYLNWDLNLIIDNLPFIDVKYLKYINSEDSLADFYETGFKFRFVFFNTIYLSLGYIIIKYFNYQVSVFYRRIFITYVILSCIYFLMFNIPYSDRIGLFSWCLIPLIVYPFFSNTERKINILRWGIFVCSILMFVFIK